MESSLSCGTNGEFDLTVRAAKLVFPNHTFTSKTNQTIAILWQYQHSQT